MVDSKIKERILDLIDQEKESITKFIQELVRFHATNGREKKCALFCADKLKKMGADVDIWEPSLEEIKRHPKYNPSTKAGYKNRPNVVGTIKGCGKGRSLLFNAHIDVVPPGPSRLWKTWPWKGVVENGKLFARGANDTKSGLACALKAIEFIQTAGVKLQGDLIVECVVDEERGGNGTLSSIMRGYKADGGIFIEPTGTNNIAIGHRGSMGFNIKVIGKSTPLDKRGEGVSAIEKMQKVIQAIEKFKGIRQKEITHPDFKGISNPVPIYIGTIKGGTWFSSIALECTIEGVMGWLPGETPDTIRENFQNFIVKEISCDNWLKNNLPVINFDSPLIEPCKIKKSHPLTRIMDNVIRDITGKRANLVMTNSGADQRLRNLYGMTPSVQFGPAGGNAHAPNEFVYLDEVITCTKIMTLCIIDWVNQY